MINKTPYDCTTHSNPWLMNINNSLAIVGEDKVSLTADYIWSKKGEEREKLVKWVFNYYRKREFPYNKLSEEELIKEYKKLKDKNPDDVINENGEIKNSSSLGNDIYKSFLWKKYFNVRGKRYKSVIDVFNNDELFLNVLKNRMGYCFSKEDGEERPYVFTISDKMILQGIRSSALGFNASLFKPVIAKYLYKHYAKKRVFDYSAGWGARALAAMSLGLEYYGIDPLTYKEINKMIEFFNGNGRGDVLNGCSEDEDLYNNIPKVDCIFSCPPYFNQEIYSKDKNQSINKYNLYEDWINIYWGKTVENCLKILEKDGYFIVVVKNKVNKYNLYEDIKNICLKNDLKLDKEIKYKTSNSHLSGKKKTGKVTKNTEIVLIFSK